MNVCKINKLANYTLVVHIHTLPDPTPIATVVPRTDEHNGWYSDGIQSIFSLACLIHASSALRPAPRNRGGLASAAVALSDLFRTLMTTVPLLV